MYYINHVLNQTIHRVMLQHYLLSNILNSVNYMLQIQPTFSELQVKVHTNERRLLQSYSCQFRVKTFALSPFFNSYSTEETQRILH